MTDDEISSLLANLDAYQGHGCDGRGAAKLIRELLDKFPYGMWHCTFKTIQCSKGHTRLHATNWIDHGCSTCAQEEFQSQLEDLRAKALAAVWLVPEEYTLTTLHKLNKEAKEVFLGKDKQTIAKLEDKIVSLRSELAEARYPQRAGGGKGGVNSVFARDSNNLDYPLRIFRITTAANGGLEIGVYLP